MNKFNQRKRYWFYAWAWVLSIYSTLYFVRPVCEFLKKTTPFALLVDIFLFSFFLILITVLCIHFKIQKWPVYFGLVMILSFYGYFANLIIYPEEKIHFLEYGFLAYLILKACLIDFNSKLAVIIAFVLSSVLGWVDELIQGILPNRYYQNEDVLLNCLSAALGLLLTLIFLNPILV